MRSLKFPAPPRATLLWLAVALGSALVWWFSLRPASASESVAELATFVLGISAIYGLPMSLLVPRVKRLLEESCSYHLFFLILGGMLGVGALHIVNTLPSRPWEAALPPPEPMAELVVPLTSNFFVGGIITRTRSGTLYEYGCGQECKWRPIEALPPPPDPDDYWSGTCQWGTQEPSGVLTPPPPRRVLDAASISYCGPDYDLDTFFILTDDGSLWTWGTMWSAYAWAPFFCLYLLSFIVGSVVAFMWGPRE